MKELTVEQKAKAYDMALENAKHYHSAMGDDVCCVLEECFPILKESEDERIKNLIYCLIRDRSENKKLLEHNGVTVEEALAWLEKQGEPVEINSTEFGTRLGALIEKFDSLPKEELIQSLSYWINVVQIIHEE